MSDGAAYSSAAPSVVGSWREFLAAREDVMDRRRALEERLGRRLYVRRSGFTHGDHLVGFETREGERDGDVVEEGLLRLPKSGDRGVAVPNLRRVAGKHLRDEMDAMRTSGPDLPGMPAFTLKGDGFGMRSYAPSLRLDGDEVWAYWPVDDVAEVDLDLWERRPLSVYYARKEALESPEPGEVVES